MKNELIPVNLQQGLILTNGYVIGLYDHHNKVVILVIPYTKKDMDMPILQDYQIIEKYTDSISLTIWRPEGQISTFEAKRQNS